MSNILLGRISIMPRANLRLADSFGLGAGVGLSVNNLEEDATFNTGIGPIESKASQSGVGVVGFIGIARRTPGESPSRRSGGWNLMAGT